MIKVIFSLQRFKFCFRALGSQFSLQNICYLFNPYEDNVIKNDGDFKYE
jgi:hypothetical protein